MYEHEEELLIPIPEEPEEYEWYLSSVKTAMFLMEWMGENRESIEASEDRIETLFNLGPGDIRNKVETTKWIVYAMRELSRLFNTGYTKFIDEVSLRVEHGIRRELIPLIRLKGVGRVRARRLYEANIKTPDDIRKATLRQIASVHGIGRQLALQIKNSVDPGSHTFEEEVTEESDDGPKQSNLFDFS
jgi:helicase